MNSVGHDERNSSWKIPNLCLPLQLQFFLKMFLTWPKARNYYKLNNTFPITNTILICQNLLIFAEFVHRFPRRFLIRAAERCFKNLPYFWQKTHPGFRNRDSLRATIFFRRLVNFSLFFSIWRFKQFLVCFSFLRTSPCFCFNRSVFISLYESSTPNSTFTDFDELCESAKMQYLLWLIILGIVSLMRPQNVK